MKNFSMRKGDRVSIGVLGLWHLGCVYAAAFANAGFRVLGFDSDKKVISNLKKSLPPIYEPKLTETIKENINKRLFFSSSTETIKNIARASAIKRNRHKLQRSEAITINRQKIPPTFYSGSHANIIFFLQIIIAK